MPRPDRGFCLSPAVKFAVVVYSSPASSQAAASAYQFVRTLLNEGHELYRLFFIADGVENANRLTVTPQDETNLPQQWHGLITKYKLDSVACVSSAIKRGILTPEEADRHNLDAHTLLDSTEIAGLGQLIDAAVNADRLVHFG